MYLSIIFRMAQSATWSLAMRRLASLLACCKSTVSCAKKFNWAAMLGWSHQPFILSGDAFPGVSWILARAKSSLVPGVATALAPSNPSSRVAISAWRWSSFYSKPSGVHQIARFIMRSSYSRPASGPGVGVVTSKRRSNSLLICCKIAVAPLTMKLSQ